MILGLDFLLAAGARVKIEPNTRSVFSSPFSEEREIQLQALSEKENDQLEHTLEAKDILRGSPEWWSVLLKAPAGTFVALSINAAAAARARVPEVMHAQLAEARQAKTHAHVLRRVTARNTN
jgi:hypothetical protein